MKAEVFIQADNCLGEGPVWDPSRNELLWVDIENKLLCFCDIVSGDIVQIEMESRIGTVALTNQPDMYLVALQSGIKLYNRKTGEYAELANPEKDLVNNRFNDGKCDPAGRFWIGSMSLEAKPQAGSLYCLNGDSSISQKLINLTISNGLDWSIDQKKMYFIDTADAAVQCFDYDAASGSIKNQQAIISVPQEYGAPDGMCIDEEGMLWIAHWGGGNVSCWNPNSGELLTRIEVPAPQVTSCCFGGENLDTLYITSARIGMNEEQLKEYPQSGAVFQIKPGVRGGPSFRFKLSV